MKKSKTYIYSLRAPLMTLFAFALSEAAFGQANNYKKSACYQEFQQVYQNAVQRTMDRLEFRRDLAFETGLVLNQPESSDWGEEEKSIVNAADLTPTYNPSKIKNESSLNAFNFIHHKVVQDFPEISPYQTREYIRKGFEEEEFCSKFIVFKFRNSRRKVANWIKDQIEDDLEKSIISFKNVSDSELDKGEFLNPQGGREDQNANGAGVEKN